QGPRLTAVSRPCAQDEAPERRQRPPMRGMSASERGRNEKRGADRRGEDAPYLIQLLFSRHGAVPGPSWQCRKLAPVLCPRRCGRRDGPYIHSALSRKRRVGQSHSMSAKPQQLGPPDVGTPASTIPMGLRIVAMTLRAVFIGALVAVTIRVS